MTDSLAANRANSLLSTGPRTDDGKRKSSLNAVKTGLTGVTVVLPTDDAAEYQRHITAYQNEFQPAGLEESELVQSLADISWRLRRIPGLEMAIYARGSVIYADQFEEEDPGVRRSLIELHTHLVYEKQLRNLQLQEARLVRRREKETVELRRLQAERKQRAQDAAAAANGFEFSNAGAGPTRPKTARPHAADADAPDARTHTNPATYPAPSVHPSPVSIGSCA
jgi:hypothetical protein